MRNRHYRVDFTLSRVDLELLRFLSQVTNGRMSEHVRAAVRRHARLHPQFSPAAFEKHMRDNVLGELTRPTDREGVTADLEAFLRHARGDADTTETGTALDLSSPTEMKIDSSWLLAPEQDVENSPKMKKTKTTKRRA